MKRKYMFPAIVVAGIAAYWFLTKNKTQAAIAPGETFPDYTDPGTDYNTIPDVPVKTYIPSAPASTIVTPVTGSASAYYPGIVSKFGANNPLLPSFATRPETDLSIIYSLIMYIPVTNTAYWNVFAKMTSAELATTWRYVTMYLNTGKPLLNATKKNPDGTWDNTNPGDPDTYNKVLAIHNKYGIF